MNIKVLFENGDSYQGALNAVKQPHGEGKYNWKDVGASYFGELKDGVIQGEGRLICQPSGDAQPSSYFGGFSSGKVHGKGVLVGDAFNFEGVFKDGRAHGPGELRISDGVLIRGLWVEGVVDTPVEITYPNGVLYSGGVDENYSPNGQGTITTPDAIIISGSFQAGVLTGPGAVKIAGVGPAIFKGSFLNGAFHGNGTYRYLTAKNELTESRYEGIFENGVPCGLGRLFDGVRLRYDGEWRDGVPHGQGWCYTAIGSRALCQFSKGVVVETKIFNKSPVGQGGPSSDGDSAHDESDSKTEEYTLLDAFHYTDINDEHAEVGTTPLRVTGKAVDHLRDTPVITLERSPKKK